MRWLSRSPAETRSLGRGLANAVAASGAVVALVGPLGAGKTVFAKGVAAGLGLDPGLVASPTFVIANEFPTPGTRFIHADFYRVEDMEEIEAAGLLDWLVPGTLLLVEWGDRFPGALPKDHLEVRLAPGESPAHRSVEARADGPASSAILERWRERCP